MHNFYYENEYLLNDLNELIGKESLDKLLSEMENVVMNENSIRDADKFRVVFLLGAIDLYKILNT